MALTTLSGDEQCSIFSQLCNTLEPGVAVAFGSASSELRVLTQAQRQQLRADYEVAVVLCLRMGLRSCKELREAKRVGCSGGVTLRYGSVLGLSVADLAMLGKLGSVLPALKELSIEALKELPAGAAGPDGVQRLAEKLGAGALPSVTLLHLSGMHVGDAGASALAAALGQGALPRLKHINLFNAAVGDAGLVALASALRRRPALETLDLWGNPFGDEGLAALVAPPPPASAGALSPPTGVLAKLRALDLSHTQTNDAGCAALVSALDSGALPALVTIPLANIHASAASKAAVTEALATSRAS